MKKNGYYICCDQTVDGIPLYGVEKKINQQMKALEKHFNMQKIVLQDQHKKIGKRLLPGSNIHYWGKVFRQLKNPALIYIRKPWTDSGIIVFFEHIKKKFPAAVILVEVPTYPYDKEQFSHPKNYTAFLKDYLSRRKFPRYVDRIVTFSRDKQIFGIETIPIMNGIIVDEIRLRRPKKDTSEIHLLAVASFQPSHGYERIIKGLKHYYNDNGHREIIIDMVGNGIELRKYKALTENLRLTDRIRFHGPKYGSELDKYYDSADIGLGCFGLYKRKIWLSSALKTREYLAYGLPVVSGANEDIFTNAPSKYFLRFSNDSSPVDIEAIVRFYDRCYNSGRSYEKVTKDIRRYAEANADIASTFAPVTDYLMKQLLGDDT